MGARGEVGGEKKKHISGFHFHGLCTVCPSWTDTLPLCFSDVVTRDPAEAHGGECLKNKLSSDCQEKYLLAKVASLPPSLPRSLPPSLPSTLPLLRMTSVYPGRALIPHTARRTPAGNGFVLQGPWGARSRGWRPSRAGPFSHGQLLHSRRVSEGKT